MSSSDLPEPPPPPETRRRAKLYVYQWIGLAVLAVLPVLAGAGVLGESFRTQRLTAGAIDVAVTYSSRLRYWQVNQIEVQVRNTSATALDTVRVSLDSAFALRFANVVSQPGFDSPFEVAVDIPPRQARVILIEIRADRYGRHSGLLTISAADTARVPLAITVFP